VTARGAVFLDRDGTLVRDPGYLHRAEDVVLLPGVLDGLARLHEAGWPLVVVSNQSGIARGLYDAEAFRAVARQIEALAAPRGIRFAGWYFCPHHPDFTGPCACRKPGVALFREAAAEHGLTLGDSWFVGDRWSDVEPAVLLGGRGILLSADPLSEDARMAARHAIRSISAFGEAARLIAPDR